jgi:hypothetical protein
LYALPNIIREIKLRRIRWAGHDARIKEMINAHNILVGNPVGKRPFGRRRHGWEDNIRMHLMEVG